MGYKCPCCNEDFGHEEDVLYEHMSECDVAPGVKESIVMLEFGWSKDVE